MTMIERCDNNEEWDEFILNHKGHPLQLWEWGQVKASHGWIAERLFYVKEDKVVAAAQVLIRRLPAPFRRFAYIPRGPIVSSGDEADFLDKLATYVKREHKAVALSVEPEMLHGKLSKGWIRAKNTILAPTTIQLDLKKTEKELLDGMAKKTRQYIRKSAADGVQIRKVRHNDDFNDCLEIYRQTAKRAGFNVHSDQYYRDVKQLMGDHSPIFAAFVNDTPVAFLWLALSAHTAYELYGGMNEEGQTRRANYALKWHAIKTVRDWGVDVYDFGGLLDENKGVSTFKKGWSSEETSLPGTWDKPLSPLYNLWTKALPRAKAIAQRFRR